MSASGNKRIDRIRDRIVINKVARWAIIINGLEIAFILAILCLIMFAGETAVSQNLLKAGIVLAALVVIWGAVVDIREALLTQRVNARMDMLRDALDKLEALNVELRGQRHDFMNHLQVVYSLMELGEYDEAMRYIERTYDDIRSVSGYMKTSLPAVNALLMAKAGDARQNGATLELKLTSAWLGLPVESWEMCRVLGNLIDNALDAVAGRPDASVTVELYEDIHAYGFRVVNNGPEIPAELRQRIFETGFTTKAKGTGMGLAIVGSIMRGCGGELRLESDAAHTSFTGIIPRVNEAKHAALNDDMNV